MTSIKEMFENDNLIITKIIQGNNKSVRIDAKRRFPSINKGNFVSKWGKESYINSLSVENYGKKINQFNCYQY